MIKHKQPLETTVVLEKIRFFCAYQERCIKEVEVKLKQWAVQQNSVSSIINQLQKEDYLNEERFVKLFAGGKFRIKKWGRYRIESELRMREIPELMVQEGLAVIDPVEYYETLKIIILHKKIELDPDKNINNRQKIINFAYGKGFELNLIMEVMNELKI